MRTSIILISSSLPLHPPSFNYLGKMIWVDVINLAEDLSIKQIFAKIKTSAQTTLFLLMQKALWNQNEIYFYSYYCTDLVLACDVYPVFKNCWMFLPKWQSWISVLSVGDQLRRNIRSTSMCSGTVYTRKTSFQNYIIFHHTFFRGNEHKKYFL